MPISAELSSRQQQQQQQAQQQNAGDANYKYNSTAGGPPPPYAQGQAPNVKKRKVLKIGNLAFQRKFTKKFLTSSVLQPGEEASPPVNPQQRPPPFYLNTQQMQMLQVLQQNQGSLNTQQQAMLAQLAHQYKLMQQHQQNLRLQQQQAAQRGLRPGQPGYPMGYAPPAQQQQQQQQQTGAAKNYGAPQHPVSLITLQKNKVFS